MAVIDKTVSSWPMNGNPLDTVGPNHGTVSGATFDALVKKAGSHSLLLDHLDDYMDVGADSSMITLTKGVIGGWLYVPSTLPTGTEFVYCGAGSDASNEFLRSSVITDGTSANFTIRYRWRSGAVFNILNSDNSFTTDAWHLVLMESTGSAYNFDVDNTTEAFTVTGTGSADNGRWFNDITYGTSPNVALGSGYIVGIHNLFFGSNLDAMFLLDDATTADDRTELWKDGAGIELPVVVAGSGLLTLGVG